uniref:Uncharacterized protein n=1 Tax=Zea mays TaxID=4577 RepID=A0A804RN73_MAIZE
MDSLVRSVRQHPLAPSAGRVSASTNSRASSAAAASGQREGKGQRRLAPWKTVHAGTGMPHACGKASAKLAAARARASRAPRRKQHYRLPRWAHACLA